MSANYHSFGLRKATARICRDRKLGMTRKGRIAQIPLEAQADDSIAVFYGEDVPFVIRKAQNGVWRLIGDAYVHGVMYGRAEEEWDSVMDDIARV